MKVRLQSLTGEPREGFTPMGIHAPGLIRWAKHGYGASRKQDRQMVKVIAESFSLKREVVLAILTGEVEVVVEGDDVVIEWPDNPLEGGE